MKLMNKVAVVTGGTGEVGQAIAARFAQEGAKLVLCSRRAESGEECARNIIGRGGEAIFVKADLSTEADAKRVIDEAVRRFGRLDIIVNNAAAIDVLKGGRDRPVTEQPTEDFDYIMKVGIYGPFWMCKYGIAEMQKNPGGSGGVVINISSNQSQFGLHSRPGYSASKGALESLTRQMATDYAEFGVRCVALRLGYVQSNDISRRLIAHSKAGPAMRALHLTRLGIPEDLGGICTYLASDEAAYVSGVIWPFDGGSGSKAVLPDLMPYYREILAEIDGEESA